MSWSFRGDCPSKWQEVPCKRLHYPKNWFKNILVTIVFLEAGFFLMAALPYGFTMYYNSGQSSVPLLKLPLRDIPMSKNNQKMLSNNKEM